MTAPIVVDRLDTIATVTFNRSEKRNAFDASSWRALADAMADIDADDDVRCVVIQGSGGHFSGGADIGAFADERSTAAQASAYGEVEMAGIHAVADCRHPVVASIRGACVGGGLEIALGCDIRVCGASSRFGVPVSRLGLTMSYEEVEFMTRALGKRASLELLLEGNIIDSARAYELGLITHVVPDDDVAKSTDEVVERIITGAPLVHRWHKQFFRRVEDGKPLSAEERAEGFAAFDTDDFQIGYTAFLEKRRPDFEGR